MSHIEGLDGVQTLDNRNRHRKDTTVTSRTITVTLSIEDVKNRLTEIGFVTPTDSVASDILEVIEDDVQESCGQAFKDILTEHIRHFAFEYDLVQSPKKLEKYNG